MIPPDRHLQITDHDISAAKFDEPRGQQLLGQLKIGSPTGPIVLLGNGAFLRDPTNAELANAIGLVQHTPVAAENPYDLVVIGAGPAGLAASVYGASRGLLTAMLVLGASPACVTVNVPPAA